MAGSVFALVEHPRRLAVAAATALLGGFIIFRRSSILSRFCSICCFHASGFMLTRKTIETDAREACEHGSPLPCRLAAVVVGSAELVALLVNSYLDRYAFPMHPTKLWLKQVNNTVTDLCLRLGAPVPAADEMFELFLNYDRSASNNLSKDELTRLLVDVINCSLSGKALRSLTDNAVTDEAKFISVPSCGQINVAITTLSGTRIFVEIADDRQGLDLKIAVQEAQAVPVREQRLLLRSVELIDHLPLHKMGLQNEDTVYLIRVAAPPELVVIEKTGELSRNLQPSMMLRQFRLSDKTKDGKPMYQSRDLWLYYQEARHRWVVADQEAWSSHDDNSWGFCSSDASHPGELVGLPWHIVDATYTNYMETFGVGLKIVDSAKLSDEL